MIALWEKYGREIVPFTFSFARPFTGTKEVIKSTWENVIQMFAAAVMAVDSGLMEQRTLFATSRLRS